MILMFHSRSGCVTRETDLACAEGATRYSLARIGKGKGFRRQGARDLDLDLDLDLEKL